MRKIEIIFVLLFLTLLFSFKNNQENSIYYLASCPLGLERLTGKRLFFPLAPETNEIRIHIALPYEILELMFIYLMKYEEMQSGIFSQANRILKIEYN
jgi:hypothetical protein